jgi:hypothetical protein
VDLDRQLRQVLFPMKGMDGGDILRKLLQTPRQSASQHVRRRGMPQMLRISGPGEKFPVKKVQDEEGNKWYKAQEEGALVLKFQFNFNARTAG